MTISIDFLGRDTRAKPITVKVHNSCWECISHYSSKTKYPSIRINGSRRTIHKLIYESCHGKIKDPSLVVRHTCDNIKCINPAHLILGTQYDNIKDREDRNRTAKGMSHGKNKLTADQVLDIRESEKPLRYLGKKFGVNPKTVSDIKARKIWKHL